MDLDRRSPRPGRSRHRRLVGATGERAEHRAGQCVLARYVLHASCRRDGDRAKLAAQRSDCAPRAGKSTLNRLELSRAEPTGSVTLRARVGWPGERPPSFYPARAENGAMQCVECDATDVSERPERTAQGYRRFRCRACGKQFNERSGGILNRAQFPSDVFRSRAFIMGDACCDSREKARR